MAEARMAEETAGMTLAEMAVEVLTTADGRAKTALSRRHAAAWFAARQTGGSLPVGHATPPDFRVMRESW